MTPHAIEISPADRIAIDALLDFFVPRPIETVLCISGTYHDPDLLCRLCQIQIAASVGAEAA